MIKDIDYISLETNSKQTVTPQGEKLNSMIDGVEIYKPNTHEDDRGSLCEIYHPE